MPERRRSSDSTGEATRDAETDLGRLRELLVGPETVQLGRLQERLDEDRLLGADVARVLPEAVRRRDGSDGELARAVRPVVEKAIQASVRRDPQPFAEAIFPVIGPAIRKAIAEGLKSMVSQLESVLEQTLSFRRQVVWRIEAARTGRPLAEIALSHSVRFRVEQAFLIHARTGLLLAHAAVPEVLARGKDVVAGMLTAIRDFVRDSFASDSESRQGELESIEVGELTVLMERGSEAVLAAVVRGVPDANVRAELREVLGEIQSDHAEALATFDGDAGAFTAAEPELERCLITELREERSAGPGRALALGAAALLLAGLVFGVFWLVQRAADRAEAQRAAQRTWQEALSRLDEQPGYVVTRAEPGRLAGLRDPLAAPVPEALRAVGLEPAALQTTFQPWSSPEPSLALARATLRLEPPGSVRLSVDDGTLRAEGSAPSAWIEKLRLLAPALPGVEGLDAGSLTNDDEERLAAAGRRLAAVAIRFEESGAARAPAARAALLQSIAADLNELAAAAALLGREPTVEVIGHSDSRGPAALNLELSRRRAENVAAGLIEAGAPARLLRTVARGSQSPRLDASGEEDAAASRRVELRVLGAKP